MTIIVPGVLPGSKGRLLYPPKQLEQNPSKWNGTPITDGHPRDPITGDFISANAQDVVHYGELKDTVYDGKLRCNGWFDEELLRQNKKTRILNALLNGQPMELSTGLFTDNEPREGVYNGQAYDFIAHNYRPDHLAILEHETGACSVQDGCGLNVNAWSDSAREAAAAARKAASKIGTHFKTSGGQKVLSSAGRALEESNSASKDSGKAKDANGHWQAGGAHDSAQAHWDRVAEEARNGSAEQKLAMQASAAHGRARDYHYNQKESFARNVAANAWSDAAREAAAASRRASQISARVGGSNSADKADFAAEQGRHGVAAEAHKAAANEHQMAMRTAMSEGGKREASLHRGAMQAHSKAAALHDKLNANAARNTMVSNRGDGKCPECGGRMEDGECTRCGYDEDSITENQEKQSIIRRFFNWLTGNADQPRHHASGEYLNKKGVSAKQMSKVTTGHFDLDDDGDEDIGELDPDGPTGNTWSDAAKISANYLMGGSMIGNKDFTSDEERKAAFAHMAESDHSGSREAADKSAIAAKTGSAKAHKAAQAAHKEAAEHHEAAGNDKEAAQHRAAERSHATAARKATNNMGTFNKDFTSDEERKAAFAHMAESDHSGSREAADKSAVASKTGSAKAHKEAQAAHKEAAEHHEAAGNDKEAAQHRAAERSHARMAKSATKNVRHTILANCVSGSQRMLANRLLSELGLNAESEIGGGEDQAGGEEDESEDDISLPRKKIAKDKMAGNQRITLNHLPPAMRRAVEYGMRREREDRDALLANLTANLSSDEAEAVMNELEGMSFEQLQTLQVLNKRQRPQHRREPIYLGAAGVYGNTGDMPVVNENDTLEQTRMSYE